MRTIKPNESVFIQEYKLSVCHFVYMYSSLSSVVYCAIALPTTKKVPSMAEQHNR